MLAGLPLHSSLRPWLLGQLIQTARPVVDEFMKDPNGMVSRVGDLLVWNGEAGTRVIGGIEQLAEGQNRIRQVVKHIETVSVASSGAIDALANMSMLALGVGSLAAGTMLWRVEALNNRIKAVSRQIEDIKKILEASNRVPLQTSIQLLKKYEDNRKSRDLGDAHKEAVDATNFYANLLTDELRRPDLRMESIHPLSRFYLLALTTQTRCLELMGEPNRVVHQVDMSASTLNELGQKVFDQVLGENAERYFDPRFKEQGVTLELLSNFFRTAKELDLKLGPTSTDAAGIFEHFRDRLPKARIASSWLTGFSRLQETMMAQLKYLMACLEEINRVFAIRLRVLHQKEAKMSRDDFELELDRLREKSRKESPKQDKFIYAWV
jgi:hypothetical protein